MVGEMNEAETQGLLWIRDWAEEPAYRTLPLEVQASVI